MLWEHGQVGGGASASVAKGASVDLDVSSESITLVRRFDRPDLGFELLEKEPRSRFSRLASERCYRNGGQVNHVDIYEVVGGCR